MTTLALRSIGRLAWRSIDAALEACVSKATATAFGHHLSLIHFGQVTNQLTGINVMDDSSLRHSHFEMRTRPTGFVSA